MNDKLKQVCGAFRIPGTYRGYEEIKAGNVNHTYKVDFLREDGTEKSYIVQQVNTYVFKNPVEVMENIDLVTEHIRSKTPGKIALHFHHTSDRKTYLFDEEGFWRLYNYIPSRTYNSCADPEIVHSAGLAFGEFQLMLSDFDASRLHVTIPDFHNTRRRFRTLFEDASADRSGRAEEAAAELAWLKGAEDRACTLTDLYNRGELPLRVTHNDTKINNVLFEREGCQAIVVIDVDTVMPGLVGHDFGDAIRSAANCVAEDCPEPERAGVNLEVFREFTDGFLMRTAPMLTETEISTLGISCFALAAELASRFLDDYILGSPYFKTDYPAHNLVRARCQIALAKDMLRRMDELEHVIRTCAGRYGA